MDAPPASGRLKVAAVIGVLAALVIAHRVGLLDNFADPARLKQSLLDLGGWGYFAFIAAYTTLQPFGVPGTVFIFAAPLVWPWPIAFALSMVGTMAASVVGFSFARFVARDWVERKIPARFRRYEGALERRGFTTVFLLRLIFWMPPLLHAFFGVSNVRFGTHFWGSLAGYVLPLFLVSFFGEQVFQAVWATPSLAWIAVAGLVIAVAASLWVQALRARRDQRGQTDPQARPDQPDQRAQPDDA